MSSLYQLIRPLLFAINAERSHDVALATLTFISRQKALCDLLQKYNANKLPSLPTEVMGITFPNPIGLAAGLDKNATAINAFAALGFGWVELGTVTPKAQPGNPKPRLFRLKQEQAIINRMGFNSLGLETFLENLQYAQSHIIKGINIGKNAATPINNAADDYALAMNEVYTQADYITINISSPNTQNLRELQQQEELGELLNRLQNEREKLSDLHHKRVPLVLKIAPDITKQQSDTICDLVRQYKIDAVAATNTTISRPKINNNPLAQETGGLSGKPLTNLSTQVIHNLYQNLQGEIPIIGIGGIYDTASAKEKIDAGANLLQIYTAFIFQGPQLIHNIVNDLAQQVNQAH